jgi:2-iminobutanoate/2-iminopropanoate deaminase
MRHVLKTTVYMTDLSKFAEMNEVYGQAFQSPFPARATVEVRALPKGAQVGIECVARGG